MTENQITPPPAAAPAPAQAPAAQKPVTAPAQPAATAEAAKPAVQPQAPAPNPAAQAEAVAAKAQEVGKKLSGFLGGLAEKAKNIDVKDLTDKAKDITEKAKQKVGEVKEKANEINSGKTEDFAQPREALTPEQMKEIMQKAAAQMAEQLPPAAEAQLKDLAEGEKILFKLKLGTAAEPALAALTDKTLIHFVKAGEHFTAVLYPLSAVRCYSLIPPRQETAGRFVIVTKADEVKLPLSSFEAYAKALFFYRKLRELTAK